MSRGRRLILFATPPAGFAATLVLASCAHVKVDPIEVKPIHIVADINVRVERQLDDFFSFEKGVAAMAATTQTTAPSVTQ